MPFRLSFKLKIILGIAFITGILLFTFVMISMNLISETQEEELIKRAHSNIHVFTETTKETILGSDLSTIERVVFNIIETSDIIYIRIYDDSGDIFYEDGKTSALLKTFIADSSLMSSRDDDIFDIEMGIIEDNIDYGRVQMGLSTLKLKENISQARIKTISLASGEILLVGLLSLMLGGYLTRQFLSLERAAQKIEQGELGYQINESSNDELGALASTFNKMSSTVKRLDEEQSQNNSFLKYRNKLQAQYISEIDTASIVSELMSDLKVSCDADIACIIEIKHSKNHDTDYNFFSGEIEHSFSDKLLLTKMLTKLSLDKSLNTDVVMVPLAK